jgi:transposase
MERERNTTPGGEGDTTRLAEMREPQVKAGTDTIARALESDYRAEHLFAMRQPLMLYRFMQSQTAECSEIITPSSIQEQ